MQCFSLAIVVVCGVVCLCVGTLAPEAGVRVFILMAMGILLAVAGVLGAFMSMQPPNTARMTTDEDDDF